MDLSENNNQTEGEQAIGETELDEINEEQKDGIIGDLKMELEKERGKTASQEKKIQYLLADFENLKKRSELDVQNKVDSIIDGMLLKFLTIYDDFIRAKDVLLKQKVNTSGLEGILRNMDSFLSEYGVRPIEAVGEIFDPRVHEAISVKNDPSLDDNTITAELRKGYILKDRIIRPSLVEISKKQIKEMN